MMVETFAGGKDENQSESFLVDGHCARLGL